MIMPAPEAAIEATWFFDVISPFAYLALGEIEQLGQTIPIAPRPILLAALLQRWNQLGPAEIAPKRVHTYRLCVFEAERRGIAFRFPPFHPFNPLRPLRLLTALDASLASVRIVMDCIWRDGLDLGSEESWQTTCGRLGLDVAMANALVEAPETKAKLRSHTEAAVAANLFGVPTLKLGNELFWGVDALPMARAYLANPDLFKSGEMLRVASIEASSRRAPVADIRRA